LAKGAGFQSEAAQKVELVVKDVLKVGGGVSSVTRRIHDQFTVKGSSILKLDDDGSGDTIGVLFVVFFTTVFEVDLVHELSGEGILDGFITVILRFQHEQLPDFVEVLELLAGEFLRLEGLSDEGGDNIHHGVISRLSGGGVLLGGITDDTESGFVSNDLDAFDGISRSILEFSFLEESQDTFDGTSRLMFVETELEMHAHNAEIITRVGEDNIERRFALGGFEESEDSFRVSEDILRADESLHSSLHADNGSFSGDSSGGTLGVTELFTSSDGSERNVMGNKHTDGRFDLFGGGTQQSTISGSRGDGTVDDVINLVGLQREDFSKSASDFINKDQSSSSLFTIDAFILLSGSDNNGVEIVVTEFTSLMAGKSSIITKDGTVRIPFSDSGGIGANSFFSNDELVRTKNSGETNVASTSKVGVVEGFTSEDSGGVGLEGQSRKTADDGISVEKLDSVDNAGRGLTVLNEVDSIFTDFESLVGVSLQGKRGERFLNDSVHY